MSILVTGATGKLGSLVVEELLKTVSADQLVVSVRDPGKADALRARGVTVRQADFNDPITLDAAFAGVERILIISADGDNDTRIRQHTNAVEAAARAGVKFIAYTSLANAAESSNIMAPPHQATERAIKQTGIAYSFLRNNWYLENEASGIQGVLAGAPWVTAAGAGKTGWALRRDYAAAAAAALTGHGHDFTTYELSGSLLTQDEFAAALGAVIGKAVPVQHVDDNAYADIMRGVGLPEFVIPIVVGIQQSIRERSLEVESNDFAKLLGRPATPVNEALADIVRDITSAE